MDKLWAPWRINYVSGKRKKGCIFCQARRLKSAGFAVFKTKYSLCILNIFPYNNGHLMVCPLRHTSELSTLKEPEAVDLFRSLAEAKRLLEKVLKPDGFNIGINIKRSAGAGIPGHLHIHIVPRWQGDTNFMPIIAGTKVISQSLNELHKKLKDAYAKTN